MLDLTYCEDFWITFYRKSLEVFLIFGDVDFILTGDFNARTKSFQCPCLFKGLLCCYNKYFFCKFLFVRFRHPSNYELLMGILHQYRAIMADILEQFERSISGY